MESGLAVRPCGHGGFHPFAVNRMALDLNGSRDEDPSRRKWPPAEAGRQTRALLFLETCVAKFFRTHASWLGKGSGQQRLPFFFFEAGGPSAVRQDEEGAFHKVAVFGQQIEGFGFIEGG